MDASSTARPERETAVSTPAPTVMLGERYVLAERLAVGGAGEVWRGEDTVLSREIAVKLLREELADDPAVRARFRDEARHAAALAHPNVAQVLDFDGGDSTRRPYLVLELVPGASVAQLLRRGTLTPRQTWAVLGQASAALAAAHRAGLVHRDVKPGNLLLRPDGLLKVTDFGIARAVDAAPVTRTGFVVGTAAYLSPEQTAGRAASAASDLYALGILAFECLSGRVPFTGEPMQVLTAHRDAAPPPLPRHVPAELAELVTALLAKDPATRPSAEQVAGQATRYGNVADLVGLAADPGEPTVAVHLSTARQPRPQRTAELAALAPPTSVAPSPPPPPPSTAGGATRSRWGRVVAAAGLLAVAAAIAVAVALTGAGHRAPQHRSVSPPSGPLPVATVTLFHPGGSSGDHPDQARLAADGNPATAWYTQHYATASFGNLRPGVGLEFDLGHPAAVATMTLQLATPGIDLAVYAGDNPDTLRAGSPVASVTSAAGTVPVRLGSPVTARYWLVWVSRLAPSDGSFRAGIAEAHFAG